MTQPLAGPWSRPSFQPCSHLGPLPHPGRFVAILSQPAVEVLTRTQDLIPREALVSQAPMCDASVPLGVRLVAFQAWASHRQRPWDTTPTTSNARYTTIPLCQML